jgi:hypothetical protein
VRARTTANGSHDGICGTRVVVIAIQDGARNGQGNAGDWYSCATARFVLIERASWGSGKRSSIRADDNKVNTKNEDGGFRNFRNLNDGITGCRRRRKSDRNRTPVLAIRGVIGGAETAVVQGGLDLERRGKIQAQRQNGRHRKRIGVIDGD